jgi:hypothetical protein
MSITETTERNLLLMGKISLSTLFFLQHFDERVASGSAKVFDLVRSPLSSRDGNCVA